MSDSPGRPLARHGEVAELAVAQSALQEMQQSLVEGPARAAGKLRKLEALLLGQLADGRIGIEHQETAVILQRIARLGLTQPGAEIGFGDRHALAEVEVLEELLRYRAPTRPLEESRAVAEPGIIPGRPDESLDVDSGVVVEAIVLC